MPNILKIFLVISISIFIIYVLHSIKKNKLSIRNSIVWLVMGVVVIICIFQLHNLTKLAHLIGIEKLSNFLFFLGFIYLIFIVFDITKTISTQNKKIITLTQELALLRKEYEDVTEKQKRNN